MSLWNETGGKLTEESLMKAMKAIRDAPPHPCSLGQHVVNPKARYKIGWYVCVNCGAPVNIHTPLSEMHSKPHED